MSSIEESEWVSRRSERANGSVLCASVSESFYPLCAAMCVADLFASFFQFFYSTLPSVSPPDTPSFFCLWHPKMVSRGLTRVTQASLTRPSQKALGVLFFYSILLHVLPLVHSHHFGTLMVWNGSPDEMFLDFLVSIHTFVKTLKFLKLSDGGLKNPDCRCKTMWKYLRILGFFFLCHLLLFILLLLRFWLFPQSNILGIIQLRLAVFMPKIKLIGLSRDAFPPFLFFFFFLFPPQALACLYFSFFFPRGFLSFMISMQSFPISRAGCGFRDGIEIPALLAILYHHLNFCVWYRKRQADKACIDLRYQS